jgi:hypothetical protein
MSIRKLGRGPGSVFVMTVSCPEAEELCSRG